MKTVMWIMDDEERIIELVEAYEEARDKIDQDVPRIDDNQSKWLYDNVVNKGDDFFVRWIEAHQTLWTLKQLISD